MPGGRPVSSAAIIDRWDDGTYSITIYARPNGAFRILHRFRGAGACEIQRGSEEEARDVADKLWRTYQSGSARAPEAEPLTLAELADRFAGRKSLSAATVRSYQQVLDLFAKHVGSQRSPRRVYRLDVVDFLDTVEAGTYHPRGQTASPRTIATYHRTLRAAFRWAVEKGWRREGDDPTDDIEIDTTCAAGAWLPYSEWEPYLTECQPAHQIRSGATLEIGLRESEVVHARDTWIRGQIGRRAMYIGPDEETGWKPKGSPRIVPLTDAAEEWIKRGRAMWKGSRYLFCGDDGISALGNLARETRAAVARAGVTRVNFHALRRSAGAHWIDCGIDLYAVSRLLGHADIRTTLRWYAAMSDLTLVAAIAQVEAKRREYLQREAAGELIQFGATLYERRLGMALSASAATAQQLVPELVTATRGIR